MISLKKLPKYCDEPKLNVHVGLNDTLREQSELLKQDLIELLNTLDNLEIESFISGPLPTVDSGIDMFSWRLGLNTWLSRTCSLKGVNFFKADGLHPNRPSLKLLMDSISAGLTKGPKKQCPYREYPPPEVQTMNLQQYTGNSHKKSG